MIICRLGLDLAGEDVLCIHKLILVFHVMLNRRAHKPDGASSALIKQAAASVDGDLAQLRVLDIVVSGPEPGPVSDKMRSWDL